MPGPPDRALATHDDRQRLGRDLDRIGHGLLLVELCLQRIAAEVKHGRSDQALKELQEATALVSDAMLSVRRVLIGGGQAALELGVGEAIRSYATQFLAHTGIAVHVHVPEQGMPARLPATHETAVLRTLQAGLSNVLEHSRAHNVLITLEAASGPAVVLAVADDGVGFSTERDPGRALIGVRRLAESLGGRFLLESWPARGEQRSRGTRLEVTLPLVSVPTL
jgi:signal transduction histidine kinase